MNARWLALAGTFCLIACVGSNPSPGGPGGVSSGGGIVTQLGPAIPSLDPTVIVFANFQHSTTPQSNTVLTGTTVSGTYTWSVTFAGDGKNNSAADETAKAKNK